MMRLIQSVYNEFIMDYLDGLIEKRGNSYHNLKNSKEQGSTDNGTTSTDSKFADDGSADESAATNESNDDDADGGASTGSTGSNSTANSNAGESDDWLDYSPMEDDEMNKARIIYFYRNKNELQESINRHEPIAGIVIRNAVTNAPDMFAVYKMPGKSFGWMLIQFDDGEGVHHVGTWFAALLAHEPITAPPQTAHEIQQLAKMASMAIPLRYTFDNGHPDRLKYCVITNWWRERNDKGRYMLPTIDFSYYNLN